jgi:hypothetical protein
MSAYVATARIERVTPRVAIGRSHEDDGVSWIADLEVEADVAAVDDADPLIDRLTAIGERWSQLTFYLFNAEGWR